MSEKTKFSNPDIDIHRKLAEWAALCAEHTLHIFEEDQDTDKRPRLAIETLRAWMRGEKTMVECRAAAFAAHAAAREASSPAAIAAARAAGQATAVAHMYTHCSHAADYAAKAAMFYLDSDLQAKRFKEEREWQWEQLSEYLRSIGFPKGI
ncbi:hypothetical protein A2707_02305 [Candidatus Saccharibacteria bacterium RIFCSPHIGHO2_01_FULL_45_15]|nr:MAG: hypothetical protein A2707_02305 [Candidatus Saccharibacteria bacterium RIFCSPHIGHO2_01_FULL_45_15]OGL32563.1 MAG: hypothetical protein A3E76_06415 [Candidatus Saccharibacteria bacterium RIFCSPHIGHO2_12_FULL_44_22]